MADLKAVYSAVDEQTALTALDNFAEKWDKNIRKYRPGKATKQFEHIFCCKIRRLIYTTNAIEGFNRQLESTKSKSVFPTDDSLFKILYLVTTDITKKWTGRRQD